MLCARRILCHCELHTLEAGLVDFVRNMCLLSKKGSALGRQQQLSTFTTADQPLLLAESGDSMVSTLNTGPKIFVSGRPEPQQYLWHVCTFAFEQVNEAAL